MDEELPQQPIWTCPTCGWTLYRLSLSDRLEPLTEGEQARIDHMIAQHETKHESTEGETQ